METTVEIAISHNYRQLPTPEQSAQAVAVLRSIAESTDDVVDAAPGFYCTDELWAQGQPQVQEILAN